ncbi:MAG: TetR/AcrR family transcriptional regulator [Candidatus Neomarinimicrobiota bacterium]
MQVKKATVRQAMLVSAREEFFKHGFAAASMHTIAARAGIAVGNLYRYYRNKVDLFEAVVKPAYDRIIDLVLLYKPEKERISGSGVSALVDIIRIQLGNLTRIMVENRVELLILVDQSGGTRFAESRGALVGAIAAQLKTALVQAGKLDGKILNDTVVRSLAVGLVEGILDIVRTYRSPAAINKATAIYIGVFMNGATALFR